MAVEGGDQLGQKRHQTLAAYPVGGRPSRCQRLPDVDAVMRRTWSVDGLARAEELYSGLCAETLGDERLWIALFRIYERTGSLMGLDSAVRRYRSALIELGATDVTDVDSVPLPDNLERLVQKIKQRIQ